MHMDCYYNKENKWSRSDSLWEVLGLKGLVKDKHPGPYVIALTGAGGKTSFIRRLAWEGKGQGARVLVTTTTHMAKPLGAGVFTGRAEDVKDMLDRQSVAVAGSLTGQGKMRAAEDCLYEAICPLADLVLVEADGSKRLPIKVPRPGEPVIPGNTDMILCISGLQALGGPASDRCCRMDHALEIMEAHGRRDYMDRGEWRIAPEDIGCLMEHGYLKPLRGQYGRARVIPVLNQADTPGLAALAGDIMKDLHEARGIAAGRLHEDESAALF